MKKKIILSSALTMLMAASVMVGASYALFTAEDKTDITVSSGNVEVVSTVDESSLSTTSMGVANPGTTFANGGTISIVDGKSVVLDKVTPGDKATFTIKVANHSNVAAMVRTKVAVVSGYQLYSGLVIECNQYNNWTPMTPAVDEIPTNIDVPVSIELPKEVGNEYKNTTAKLSLIVEAVQGNADVYNDKIVDTKTDSVNEVTVAEVKTENVEVKSDNEAVKVNFPKTNVDPTAEKVVLTVTAPTSEDKAKFKLTSGEEAVYYDIDVAGANTSAGPVEVTLFAGKGLENVKVHHNKGAEGVETIEDVVYNSTTGFVTFKTTSFSAFAIVASKVLLVPADGTPEENGAALNEAISDAGDNAILKLSKGEYCSTNDYRGYKTSKNLTIVGVGSKTILSHTKTGPIFETDWSGHVNLKKLKISVNYETFAQDISYGAVWCQKSSAITLDDVSFYIEREIEKNVTAWNPIKIDLGNGEFVSMLGNSNIAYESGPDKYEIMSNGSVEKALQEKTNIVLEHDVYLSQCIADFATSTLKWDSLLKNHTITIDLNNHKIAFAYSNKLYEKLYDAETKPDGSNSTVAVMLALQGDNTLTIKGNGIVDATINDHPSYIFDVGCYPEYPRTATLNIEGGTYYGGTSVVQLSKGACNVKGGHFELCVGQKNPDDPDELATYLFNCIDASYKAGTAIMTITGGTFVNYNPADNASEVAHTNYLPKEGYTSTSVTKENGEIWYTVGPAA